MVEPRDLGNREASSGWFRAVSTSIRSKLLLGMFAVAVIPLLVLGAAVYFSAEQAVMAKSVAQLEAVRSNKATQLQQHFQTLEAQIATFAENRMVVEAMRDFRVSFRTAIEGLLFIRRTGPGHRTTRPDDDRNGDSPATGATRHTDTATP